MLMVKPALAYPDALAEVKRATNLPVAAYNVSGESRCSLGRQGGLDRREAGSGAEMLTGMKRGATILTYSAVEAARWLQD
jgi:porphobilinogen synthase